MFKIYHKHTYPCTTRRKIAGQLCEVDAPIFLTALFSLVPARVVNNTTAYFQPGSVNQLMKGGGIDYTVLFHNAGRSV